MKWGRRDPGKVRLQNTITHAYGPRTKRKRVLEADLQETPYSVTKVRML